MKIGQIIMNKTESQSILTQYKWSGPSSSSPQCGSDSPYWAFENSFFRYQSPFALFDF